MSGDHYENLVTKLGFPGSDRLKAVLEHLITPEQALIADNLPGDVAETAENTGVDQDKVKESLEDMFDKGVVFPRGNMEERNYYRFARDIIQLHDATQASGKLDPVEDKKLYELWHDFCRREMYPFISVFAQNLPQPMGKVVPAYKAIKDLPGVQPWENFSEILKAQERIAVVPCSCRSRTTAVGENCNYVNEPKDWKCLQFGRGAEYVIARGSGREISLQEALEIADRVEEEGLVHIGNYDDSMKLNTSCQCCQDCCEIFVAMSQNEGNIGDVYAPSRFTAVITEDECDGCGICEDYCQFNAIEVNDQAAINPESCFGCGICVVKCANEAVKLKPQNNH